ncbi:hypothetical protein HOU02_gp059 [Caulobacter phage CcrBL9]|uniref:Exonuclease domain-containing protein n=1 Tax=Caulobacter phage CcrBL9 TaxID=2283270 RepID=A0A385EBB3_9CAUD|nr:hypothetical protein HOU02_gp059 [Caulobacter phage CcrBL9]AXQ69083.1 hypothetical protein CcrBL9_gp059c [Caulobacter phage CcrBL9]
MGTRRYMGKRVRLVNKMLDAHYARKYTNDGRVVHVEGWDERLVRIQAVKGKLRARQREEIESRLGPDALWDKLEQVRKVIAAGGTILAIDTEFDERKNLTEVGLSTFGRGGYQTRNLRPVLMRHRKDRFKYGQTEVLGDDLLKEEVETAVAQADIVVGHSLGGDVRMLSGAGIKLTPRATADTAFLSSLYYGAAGGMWMTLGNLCRKVGIELNGLHCGGNDAYYTAQALVRMAETLRKPEA